MSAFVYDAIKKSISIVEYLSQRGIQPHNEYSGKYTYICPIPSHKDTKPSFIVYDNANGMQSFCCFGCKSGGSIIELISAMESRSKADVVSELSGGLEISGDAEINFILNEIKNDIAQKNESDTADEIASICLAIGVLSFGYWGKTDFDAEELIFLEAIYSIIDVAAINNDLATLIDVYKYITEDNKFSTNLFEIRFKQWEEQYLIKKREEMEAFNKIGKRYGV
ncbi:MAG: CHC2 zinc finger domain-containing protein [Phenylobacterium sp.]